MICLGVKVCIFVSDCKIANILPEWQYSKKYMCHLRNSDESVNACVAYET